MLPSAIRSTPLTSDIFRDLAAARLHAAAPVFEGDGIAPLPVRAPSDFDLNPGAISEWRGAQTPRPAAVLVPVVAREDLTVLLTQRTDHLPAHAGQVAFPGGKPHPEDRGPVDTALREAEEEIGLDPALVEPLGFLDNYRTGTGFAVTPVVALVRPPFALKLNAGEVADAFEVPLAFLMDPANHQIHARTLAGRPRQFYAMPFGERYIWGATAGILKNMQEMLFSAA